MSSRRWTCAGVAVAAVAVVMGFGESRSVMPSGSAGGDAAAAPSAVTLFVHPTLIRRLDERLTIRGFVTGRAGGEKVTIQFKACGLLPLQFRDRYETTTDRGGGFSQDFPPPLSPGVSGVFRAVHRDSVSAEIPIRHHAPVRLFIRNRGRFQALVSGGTSFWRRYVVLQRFQRRGGWVSVRRLVLTEQWGGGGSVATVVTAEFRPPVPRGTRIRVVFPLSQAKPCYLAGVSEVRRA